MTGRYQKLTGRDVVATLIAWILVIVIGAVFVMILYPLIKNNTGVSDADRINGCLAKLNVQGESRGDPVVLSVGQYAISKS